VFFVRTVTQKKDQVNKYLNKYKESFGKSWFLVCLLVTLQGVKAKSKSVKRT